MLHQVDLVDVSARDRRPDGFDRVGVLGLAPGRLPVADPEGATDALRLVLRPDAAREEGERAWLWRARHGGPAKSPRQPVAEVEVGDDPEASVETGVVQVRLERLEGAFCPVELEHGRNAIRVLALRGPS